MNYERPVMESNAQGWMVIPVLEFLNGKPWNDMSKSFVSALRPSVVRLCRESATCDAITWRVTVWINKDDKIKRIEQEVSYNVYGVEHSHSNTFPKFPYNSSDMHTYAET